MKKDKIFNNSYGEQDLSKNNVTFKIDPTFLDNGDPDDKIHYELLLNKVHEIIQGTEFEELNKVTEDGILKKLNKVQINQVFSFVIKKIGKDYTKIEIFSVLSDYFDVLSNKFYNSLSNKYKDELICELDEKYNLSKKKPIRKLF